MYRPSRSTTAAASAGRAHTSAVSRPGSTRTPDSGSSSADGSAGGSAVAASGGGWIRSRAATRPPATTPRLR